MELNEFYANKYIKLKEAYSILDEDEISVIRESIDNDEELIAFLHIIDGVPLDENMVRFVNAKGEKGMRKSRDVRSKLAYKTTSLSKAKRRETALKASKSRMANPSQLKRAIRKRNKARKKRLSLGMDSK